MHRHDGPRDHAAASHVQLLTRRQLDFRCLIQKLFLHSVVIFLPTVVRERSHIVEDQAAVLGVELPGGFRISSAPSRAKAVDEFAKRSVVRGLCCARAPTNVTRAPTIASTTYSTHRHRSAFLWTALPIDAATPYLLATQGREFAGGMSQRVTHTVVRSAQFCKRSNSG